MKQLFDSFIKRFSHETKDRLRAAISHQTDLNPNDRLYKGICVVLKETLAEIDELKSLLNMKMEFTSKGFLSGNKNKQVYLS